MTKPNIGDSVTMKNGLGGQIFGTLESADGEFVQFSATGDWVAWDPVEEAAPADAAAEQPAGDVIQDQVSAGKTSKSKN